MKSADAQRDNIEQLNEHNCPTETIRSWRDLMAVTSRYMDTGIRYAYRGEADQSWDLVPSLLRLAPDATADRLLRLERDRTKSSRLRHIYTLAMSTCRARTSPRSYRGGRCCSTTARQPVCS